MRWRGQWRLAMSLLLVATVLHVAPVEPALAADELAPASPPADAATLAREPRASPGNNGLIYYLCGSGLCSVDPVSGETAGVVSGFGLVHEVSPDGKQLAFPGDSSFHQLVIIDVTGEDRREVDTLPWHTAIPERVAWSPDGSELAFVCYDPTDPGDPDYGWSWQICRIGVDGTGPTQISDFDPPHMGPLWSPGQLDWGGGGIAFGAMAGDLIDGSDPPRYQDGQQSIWTMSAAGGAPAAVSRGSGIPPGAAWCTGGRLFDCSEAVDVWPSWSPGGTSVAYARSITTYVGPDPVCTEQNVLVGPGAAPLTSDPGRGSGCGLVATFVNDFPSWSPDGTMIALMRRSIDAAGTVSPNNVWTIGVTGADLRQLTFGGGYKDGPVWAALVGGQSLVVNTAGDASDLDTGDQVCDVSDQAGNQCTLRAAIEEAEDRAGDDSITFDIPGGGVPTITVAALLPPLTQEVTIDGTTQPGGLVEVSGGPGLPAGTSGLWVQGGDSELRGLVINGFPGAAILIEGPGRNVIAGNRVGTDAGGTLDRGNGIGVHIRGSANNRIGGPTADDRNLISGQDGFGVVIEGSASEGNHVLGNYIGTDVTGSQFLADGTDVGVAIVAASGNVVGGATSQPGTGAGNRIFGSADAEVAVFGEGAVATGNRIEGNLLRGDPSLSGHVMNLDLGVLLTNGASATTIGGSSGLRNVLFGHRIGVLVNGAATAGNHVLGNYIGTNITGGALPPPDQRTPPDPEDGFDPDRSSYGVLVDGAPGNTVGQMGAGNVVAGHDVQVEVIGRQHFPTYRWAGSGSPPPTATNGTGNVVAGNLLGPFRDGSSAPPRDGGWGVALDIFASDTVVGPGNVIAGNGTGGVLIDTSDGNRVVGNFIGTTSTGTAALPGQDAGVLLEGSSGNDIGGADAASRNVISGNEVTGVRITGTFISGVGRVPSVGNRIRGNYIGTTASGASALGNDGNGIDLLLDAIDTAVGGSTAGEGNVISGNALWGIVMDDDGEIGAGHEVPRGTVIRNNRIGTTASGAAAIGNGGGIGASMWGEADTAITGNTIAYSSKGPGVGVEAGHGITILSNRIFSNVGMAIDLAPLGKANATPSSEGPGVPTSPHVNGAATTPALFAASVVGSATGVLGGVLAEPGSAITIQLFEGSRCLEFDGVRSGEGERIVHTADPIVAGSDGVATFLLWVPERLTVGRWVSATATTERGTSEFSDCVIVLEVDDYDADGVPDWMEDRAPNDGDGNRDGVPDSRQANVASLPGPGGYVSLAVPLGSQLEGVATVGNPSPVDAPAGVTFPLGFFSFEVTGLEVGGTVTVDMHIPEGTPVDAYWRYGPTPDNPADHWYDFAYDGTTGFELVDGVVRLHFVDGGRGDDNPGTPDGTIVDPGAPAETALLPASVGLVDPATGRWHLRDYHTAAVTSFYFGNPGDVPFMADWDCDGIDTPGLFRQSDAYAYLRNSNDQGVADVRFFFGDPADVPLAGDWNGDGCDTLAIYRPSEQRFYIINRLGENEGGLGAADYSFLFGNPGDKPVAGDWDGDGITEVGLHRESTGFFYWRDTLDTGIASGEIFFGDPGDRFVAGDWGIVDVVDTPAVFRPGDVTFYVRHTLTEGIADSQFPFGDGGFLPVAGVFAR